MNRPKINSETIPGMPAGDLARLSFTARKAIGLALKHGWRVEMNGHAVRFYHPINRKEYKLATIAGLNFMSQEIDWIV